MSENEELPEELTPEFVDQAERVLYTEAKIGEELDRFLTSDLGRMLCGMAEQDQREAAYSLLAVKPDDIEAIKDLQLQALVAENFMNYLSEVRTRATTSEQQLMEYRH